LRAAVGRRDHELAVVVLTARRNDGTVTDAVVFYDRQTDRQTDTSSIPVVQATDDDG